MHYVGRSWKFFVGGWFGACFYFLLRLPHNRCYTFSPLFTPPVSYYTTSRTTQCYAHSCIDFFFVHIQQQTPIGGVVAGFSRLSLRTHKLVSNTLFFLYLSSLFHVSQPCVIRFLLPFYLRLIVLFLGCSVASSGVSAFLSRFSSSPVF